MLETIAIALAVWMVWAMLAGEPARAGATRGWDWPVVGDVITSYRNGDDPYAAGQHRGVDIAAAAGTSVRSSTHGRVAYAGRLPDSGNCVTVLSGDGVYLVSYLHLSKIAVRRGASVASGAKLGETGTTGSRSAGAPHLHFGVRVQSSGAYVDPMTLLGPPPGAETPADATRGETLPETAAPPVAQQRDSRRAGSRPTKGVEADAHAQARARARARAKARAQARAEARARTRSRSRIHSEGTPAVPAHPHRRTYGRSNADGDAAPRSHSVTDQVHAHPQGDEAGAAPTAAAEGSARESHASRGRVAPPPFSNHDGAVTDTRRIRGRKQPPGPHDDAAANDAAANDAAAVSTNSADSPAKPSRTGRTGGIKPFLVCVSFAAITLACFAALRRFRRTRDGNPPSDTRPITIARPLCDRQTPPTSERPILRVISR